MTLAARLALGFVLLVILMAGLAVHLLLTIRDFHQGQAELVAHHIEAIDLRVGLRRDLESIREFSRKLFALSDPDYAPALETLRQSVRETLDRLVRAERSPETRAAIGRFAERWRAYVESAPEAERRAVARRAPSDPSALLARLDELREILGEIDETAQRTAEAQLAATAEGAARARRVAGLATALSLGAALVIALVIARSVLEPIRRLARGASEIADGNFTYQVPERGGPELASLAREFNTMARRLAELDDLKREFVSSVSHDLKAPLASMQETTRLLLDGTVEAPGAGQEKLLRLQLECGERLSRMIEDLLAMARLEAGVAGYEIESVEMAELASSVAREAGGLVAAKGLELSLEAEGEGFVVAADRPHLARAVWNLLSNAVRFTPQGGRLGIALVRRNSRVELRVWDTGPGVPDPDKQAIFERFYRGPGGSGTPRGTGLGLAIARRVAADHRGDLRVEDHPEGGAVFVLTLPIEPGREANA